MPTLKKRLAQSELARLIDSALAHHIDPKDCLLITGFWRSGTTWLQQFSARALNAKTVFEPISPDQTDAHGTGLKDVSLFHMPFASANFSNNHRLGTYLSKAVRSSVADRWTRHLRKNITESFQQRTVLKDVRASLCAHAIVDIMDIRAIHLRRDPRSVLASILRGHWGKWLEPLSLKAQLLEIDDGRSEYFERWRSEIEFYDKKCLLKRVTAYWAMTELFLEYSFSTKRNKIVLERYESLVRNPTSGIPAILRRLGYPVLDDASGLSYLTSATAVPGRWNASLDDLTNGWRRELSVAQSSDIESVIRSFDGFLLECESVDTP
ncbi:sulfotransferase domain-containing protein [Solilutibacter silvestris]|uniref:Sulfotransferase domain-containing protein n=1 Tax=Solilutibacter silvestris TaxID=1645665 RepID=A0A2K1PX04_9GAMM|nr:sulfotransferase domain-containing protein [Lysobacter silvestris]PNS07323.1 Sulfotransferase domain-containing protein [Lysobacter silvestris]